MSFRLLVIAVLTLPFATSAQARESKERARTRQAVERSWEAHSAERAARANEQYPQDPFTLKASVGKIRVGAKRVWFEGIWTWSPHRVHEGKARAFVWRADLEAGRPLEVHFGGRTVAGMKRSLVRARGTSTPFGATMELTNPAEIEAYARASETEDPLSRWRIAESVTDWGRPETEASWWMALRSIDTPAVPWPAPRSFAKVLREVRRSATRNRTGDWLYHAVSHVEHPEEIRAIVEFVARGGDPRLKSEIALTNLRFLAKDLIVPLQSKVWLKAVDELEANPPAPLPRSEQKPWPIARSTPRIIASLRKGLDEHADWTARAFERLRNPVEIRRVVRYLRKDANAEAHLSNLETYLSGYISSPNEQAWKDALASSW